MGGLNMINLNYFIKSLKVTWIRRMETSYSSWAILLRSSLPNSFCQFHLFGNEFLKGQLNKCDPFWIDVFQALIDFRHTVKENVLTTPVWYNENILVDNQTQCILALSQKGIYIIDDFLNDRLEILNFEDFINRYQIRIPFTTFYSLTQQIKQILRNANAELKPIQRPIIPKFIQLIMSDEKGSRKIYESFNNDYTETPKYESKWIISPTL